jgi:hypothetical protein
MTPLVQPFQDPADRFPPVRLDRANVAAAEHRDVVGLVAFDEPTLQGNWDQAIIRRAHDGRRAGQEGRP